MSECEEVAEQFIGELLATGKCLKADVTGSLRRGEPYTHDVDVICADPTIPPHTSPYDSRSKLKQERNIIRNNCKIDLYRANEAHYGALMLMTTSPAGSQIGMRRQAKKKGYKLNHYGIWKDDTIISLGWTEDEICKKILGRPCKPPELRGK